MSTTTTTATTKTGRANAGQHGTKEDRIYLHVLDLHVCGCVLYGVEGGVEGRHGRGVERWVSR